MVLGGDGDFIKYSSGSIHAGWQLETVCANVIFPLLVLEVLKIAMCCLEKRTKGIGNHPVCYYGACYESFHDLFVFKNSSGKCNSLLSCFDWSFGITSHRMCHGQVVSDVS